MSDPRPLTPVVILEDDASYREMVGHAIATAGDLAVAGQFGSVEEALAAEAVNAEVILLDVNLPGKSGVQGLPDLRTKFKDPDVVMLTVFDNAETVFEALKTGASGYLSKRASADEIVAAIREVRDGGAPMSSAIARKVIASFRDRPEADRKLSELTDRENDILRELARGRLDKEIADQQGIALTTVKTHLRSIYQKLQVQNRTEAARRFME